MQQIQSPSVGIQYRTTRTQKVYLQLTRTCNVGAVASIVGQRCELSDQLDRLVYLFDSNI